MHIEYSPHQSISLLVKKLKGRTSHHLQQEFPNLRKRYWGQHFWSIGYGVLSTGVVSDKMVQDYLEHHRDIPNADDDTWVLGQMKISFSSAIP